jgi:hypothetical protein
MGIITDWVAHLESVRNVPGTVPILLSRAFLATLHTAKWGLSPSLLHFPDRLLVWRRGNRRPQQAVTHGPGTGLLSRRARSPAVFVCGYYLVVSDP